MAAGNEVVTLYREIADIYDRRGQGSMRDRFLVLAADAALNTGQADEAEALRRRLLASSPHHLLKPYNSFGEALQAPDLASYVRDLRRNYPPQAAAQLR